MIAGTPARIEFEYERHGTLTLIGNFQVTTGELIAPTIGPTRTEADFASHIEQTVATDPGASWVFVTDNLNIHCSETLVKLVAKACEITTTLGKKGVRGVLKSVASRQAFLSEPSHRIRFVYTPKHSSWLNQIEVVFGVIMRKVIRRGSFTSVNDLRDKLLNFIETVASFLEFFRPRTGLMQGLRGLCAIGRLLIPLHVQGDTLANVFSRPH